MNSSLTWWIEKYKNRRQSHLCCCSFLSRTKTRKGLRLTIPQREVDQQQMFVSGNRRYRYRYHSWLKYPTSPPTKKKTKKTQHSEDWCKKLISLKCAFFCTLRSTSLIWLYSWISSLNGLRYADFEFTSPLRSRTPRQTPEGSPFLLHLIFLFSFFLFF